VWRSIALILLSIFLMSIHEKQTSWAFMNVLAQIGLGYTFLFLLWDRSPKIQALAAVLILAGTAAAYETYPDAGIDLETGAPEVGITQEWAAEHLTGIRKPWHKNANVGHKVDVVVLNKFPGKTFEYNKGGYQTINFIPSLATMIFGLMCGGLLRSDRKASRKLLILWMAGLGGLALGQLLNQTGVCPSIKRIWTPAWAIFSTGWCCLILATLYLFVDVFRLRWLAFPLIVVGMNSILIYCMGQTLPKWTAGQLQVHFGQEIFTLYSHVPALWEPTVRATLVGLVFWLVCFFLYRRKIFLAI
jgi:predicted acyltransferase